MTTQTTEQIKDFLEELVTANTDVDTIYIKLSEFTGEGILKSINTYKKFLRDTNRVMTSEERSDKIRKALDGYTFTETTKTADLVGAIQSVVELSSESCKRHIKNYLEANNITLAKVGSSNMAEVANWLVAEDALDLSDKEVKEKLKEFGLKDSTVERYFKYLRFHKLLSNAINNH